MQKYGSILLQFKAVSGCWWMYNDPILDQLDENAILYLRDIKRKKDIARKEIAMLERQILEVTANDDCVVTTRTINHNCFLLDYHNSPAIKSRFNCCYEFGRFLTV